MRVGFLSEYGVLGARLKTMPVQVMLNRAGVLRRINSFE